MADMSEELTDEKRAGSRIVSGFAVFLALIAIATATYPVYELFHRDVEDAELDRKLNALKARVRANTAQIDELKINQDQVEEPDEIGIDERLNKFSESFQSQLDLMKTNLSTTREDWLFAEVEYLVRMANQRALMEEDESSALQLLIAADQIVRDVEGISAHDLRAALSNDIASLRTVSGTDIQGIYLKISALIRQVPNLRREPPKFETSISVETEKPSPNSFLDYSIQLLTEIGGRLSSLIDFRQGAPEVKPILPPDQIYYLRQNLVLKLQIAQMALLEGQEGVYQVSLDEARIWLSDSFDDDKTRQSLIASLSELQAENIVGDLPDISASLDAVRDLSAGSKKGLGE